MPTKTVLTLVSAMMKMVWAMETVIWAMLIVRQLRSSLSFGDQSAEDWWGGGFGVTIVDIVVDLDTIDGGGGGGGFGVIIVDIVVCCVEIDGGGGGGGETIVDIVVCFVEIVETGGGGGFGVTMDTVVCLDIIDEADGGSPGKTNVVTVVSPNGGWISGSGGIEFVVIVVNMPGSSSLSDSKTVSFPLFDDAFREPSAGIDPLSSLDPFLEPSSVDIALLSLHFLRLHPGRRGSSV
ncbi:hypothetical protein C0Q70_16119 [Pomacea canaliculata]|uniref:Uncharacterized protein n=1 Tax=Pomacea canaliculata TaxID=400727 RepID=A0A2T7NNV6_POMCA|nr:hypothetical protein C0Q70_16119 [Pomacea canaliculata]